MLGWYENLEKKDVPPEHIWEDVEGLELWWKRVEDRRSDGRDDLDYNARPTSDDEDGADEHQPGAMAENSLAKHLKNM